MKRIELDLPKDLEAMLAESAKARGVTLHDEIVKRIREAFDLPEIVDRLERRIEEVDERWNQHIARVDRAAKDTGYGEA